MDEETGSVDDLDPSAVDEKMWDDMKKESEKDKELKNDEAKGSKTDDQTAADGEKDDGQDLEGIDGQEEIEEEEEHDDGEGVERPEAENMDPHPEDEKTLDLPEELDFTGGDDTKDEDISDDGMDDLSDVEESKEDFGHEQDEVDGEEKPLEDADDNEEVPADDEGDQEGTGQDDEIMEDQPDQPEEDRPEEHDTRETDLPQDEDQTAGGDSGAANETEENPQQEQDAQGVNQSEKEIDPQQAQPGKAPENEEQGDSGKGAPNMVLDVWILSNASRTKHFGNLQMCSISGINVARSYQRLTNLYPKKTTKMLTWQMLILNTLRMTPRLIRRRWGLLPRTRLRILTKAKRSKTTTCQSTTTLIFMMLWNQMSTRMLQKDSIAFKLSRKQAKRKMLALSCLP